MNRILAFILLVSTSLAACLSSPEGGPHATPNLTPLPTSAFIRIVPAPGGGNVPPVSQPTVTPEATTKRPATPTPSTVSTQASASTTPTGSPTPDTWTSLPVIPVPNESIREIHALGQTLGNNPNAFSIFGDCQTKPDEFFGIFETDPLIPGSLPLELRETIFYFNGSFNRESPTVQDGTTPGALLWSQWHRGEYGCTFDETPVECELRVHRPSFVIIQVGTHFESRNTEYLHRIITYLVENGVVPILATKADNRELDHRVNRDMALLAAEFDLPLWNFWAALSDLPNRGLYTRDDRPLQGDIYLTEEAQEIHRITGLAALNIVWRAATGQ